jgi:hypothetical protein
MSQAIDNKFSQFGEEICIEEDHKTRQLDEKFISYGYEKLFDNGVNVIYGLPL